MKKASLEFQKTCNLVLKSGKEQLSKVYPKKKLISFAKLISACERINFKPRQEL